MDLASCGTGRASASTRAPSRFRRAVTPTLLVDGARRRPTPRRLALPTPRPTPAGVTLAGAPGLALSRAARREGARRGGGSGGERRTGPPLRRCSRRGGSRRFPCSRAMAAARVATSPTSGASASVASDSRAMCFLGTTSRCVGALGEMSSKAKTRSSSKTLSRRDLARDDLAEEAVRHGRSLLRRLPDRPATGASARNAPDAGAERIQLLFHPVVAAVEVIDAVHDRRRRPRRAPRSRAPRRRGGPSP